MCIHREGMNPDLYVVFQDEINVIRILIAFQGRSLEFRQPRYSQAKVHLFAHITSNTDTGPAGMCLLVTFGGQIKMTENKSKMGYVFYYTYKRQLLKLISTRLPMERWDNSYISVVNNIHVNTCLFVFCWFRNAFWQGLSICCKPLCEYGRMITAAV